MASYEYTFQSGESLTPTKLNSARTVSDIVNADISASAAIALSKLASVTAGSVLMGNASNVPTATAITGDVTLTSAGVTAIAAGAIVNADINATAAIVDTKLATISTALKVANSATTAASANTASAIVARDASGNFAAGTITATLTGTASVATNIAGGSNGSVPYQSGSSTTALLAAGSAGQVLTSNGSNAAPSWQAAANVNTNANNLTGGSAGTVPYQSAAGTTEMTAAGTSGQVLQSNGTAAPTWRTIAPYGVKAWVQIDMTSISGTYSQTGTSTVTITITGHGLTTGQNVGVNYTSGGLNTNAAGQEGDTTVTVVNANSFTVTASSGTNSGNVSIFVGPTIMGSGNVSSITDNGVGDYTVNYSSGTFSNANYAAVFVSGTDCAAINSITSSATRLTNQTRSGTAQDVDVCLIATDL